MADRFAHRRRFTRRLAPPAADGGVAIGRIVAEVVKTFQREAQPPWTADLTGEWPTLVGTVAAHARPGRLVNGELIVYVDSSVWLSELQRYGEKEMLENLQRRFGRELVRRIRLQLDPGR